MRQAEALAGCAGRQKQRAHAGGLPDAQRAHVRFDELHGVVDRESCGHDATRRVDVQVDVLVRIFGLQEQQLGDDETGDAGGTAV